MSLIKNLFYRAGNFHLDIPEWKFSERGMTALTGVSGSGKSTLLKILCGLLPCPGLSWEYQGQDLAKEAPSDRQISICFQDLRLFPHQTARQNLLFALKARGLSFKEREKDFEYIISFLGLNHKLNLLMEDLSGGEQQRLALARALIVPSHFLFLDEPFSYLDQKNKEKARLLTLEMLKKHSLSLLLVSHDREDIKGLADEEFYLSDGKIHKRQN